MNSDLPRLIDISPPLTPRLGVWPGDTPPAREVLLDLARGDNVTLSTLRSTVHAGAHADAPSHYGLHAATIEQRPLALYLGECAVLHVTVRRGERVSVEQFEAVRQHLFAKPAAARRDDRLPARVLIATGTFPDAEHWNDDFAALAPELVDHLNEAGVRLVGIDTPSVDFFHSKDLPAHKRFLALDMAILEGLVLRDVPAGVYELIALPLPLAGFDASPVRAVLRTTRA
jgi:arylformamidase